MQCENPRRGVWGGPPGGGEPMSQPATNTAFAPRGKVELPNLVAQDIPEIGVKQGVPLPGGAGFANKSQGCGCQGSSDLAGGAVVAGLGMGVMGVIVLRRRRRR